MARGSASKGTTAIVPSCFAKVARAEKHLVELKEAIDEYARSRPYTVRERTEGKMQARAHHLVFTAHPANTDIPVIAADVIYNLRSALDHLMASIVANKDRDSVIFPVFFEGVWDAAAPGENAERVKQRTRWASDTASLRAPALAILKALQPSEGAEDNAEVHRLKVLNSLSNRDRHEKLPVLVAGLTNFTIGLTMPDGQRRKAIAEPSVASDFAHDGAQLRIPDGAVDVEIHGAPLIVVRIGQEKGGRISSNLPLPEFLSKTAAYMKVRVLKPLTPFLRR